MRDVETSVCERNIRPLASGVNSIRFGGAGLAISEISGLNFWLALHTIPLFSTQRICQQKPFRKICVMCAVMLMNPIAKSRSVAF
jgi:hypothetical protein